MEQEILRLPATYANFLILNKAVIYPTYNQPEKDEEARKQIQLAFPDRKSDCFRMKSLLFSDKKSLVCPTEVNRRRNLSLE